MHSVQWSREYILSTKPGIKFNFVSLTSRTTALALSPSEGLCKAALKQRFSNRSGYSSALEKIYYPALPIKWDLVSCKSVISDPDVSTDHQHRKSVTSTAHTEPLTFIVWRRCSVLARNCWVTETQHRESSNSTMATSTHTRYSGADFNELKTKTLNGSQMTH